VISFAEWRGEGGSLAAPRSHGYNSMTVFSTTAAGRDRTVPVTIRRPSGEAGGALPGHGGRLSDDAKIAAFAWHRGGYARAVGRASVERVSATSRRGLLQIRCRCSGGDCRVQLLILVR
jgi:hypothetical protein